jgi:DNA-binding response OmpR family regulator
MKVLLVEDEHRIAQSIKRGLEQERFIVDVVFTGNDGYDLASTEAYDVILLDWMLPDMDGKVITNKLRQQQIQTPIIMLTAKGQVHEKVEGLDSGVDDYVTKPFSFEELLARMRAIVRRPKQLVSTDVVAGDLYLDPVTFEVKRGDKEIHLSQKEFSLLNYLMRHANQIVTKEQLISQVWDYDADILPNTVEAYIKNLRKKIDVPFPDQPQRIKTLRGFGYKLVT